ncbi:hypothetical protein [Geomicrobium sp. JCM 19038]|uniref:hypothetical protein n=1 Tax=Geomicrobium sp. JCM 19038 TaxID=1460635 RepID=UPI001267F2AC|nr:hypothetical protein [Geomicrobium sp. JCM 19038]
MQQRTIINNIAILDHEQTITRGHLKISNGTITEVSDEPFVAQSFLEEQDVVHNYEANCLCRVSLIRTCICQCRFCAV